MKHDNILIKNIYYMLSYVYETTYLKEYKRLDTTKYHNLDELYTHILIFGVSYLIKSGLVSNYINTDEASMTLKGKLNINETIKTNSLVNKKVWISFDEYSTDNLMNQIIKASLLNVRKYNPREIDKILLYFNEVTLIKLDNNIFDNIIYNRHNKRYEFIINICYLLYNSLMLTDENGTFNFNTIASDKQLHYIFEKYVYKFYERNTNFKVSSPQIKWNTDDNYTDKLPKMKTDIVLKEEQKTYIIDTKFYSHSMNQYGNQISSNMYQIFTYINNYKPAYQEEVVGILLYVKTKDQNNPNHQYKINGNEINIFNINLDQDIKDIEVDLLKIIGL